MIRIICPQDPSIRCVERQARRLDRRLGVDSRIYVLKPNDESKYKCHYLIRHRWTADDVIIFMGHGRSDRLFGSVGNLYNAMGVDNAIDRNSEDYYYDERFIDEGTYGIFSKKTVICFACESDQLAKMLIGAGASAIVGFGKMPSSREEFEADAHITCKVSNAMIAHINGSLNIAFRDAVIKGHRMNGTIADVAVYFKLEMARQVSLLLHSKAKYRYDLANVLYNIAKTVTVVGNKNVRI